MPGRDSRAAWPYLPSNADGLIATWLAKRLATDIGGQSGWSVLLLPEVLIGHSGANDIGRRFTFPGTIGVRAATLRNVYMDIADALRAQGFKWVFSSTFTVRRCTTRRWMRPATTSTPELHTAGRTDKWDVFRKQVRSRERVRDSRLQRAEHVRRSNFCGKPPLDLSCFKL